MPKLALIVNPLATAVDEHRIKLVERVLSRAGDVQTVLTQHRGHGTELTRALGGDVDAIFVFSGDGGFNEVVNGIAPDGPPLGCIPGGGTSVFPRALGIPRDPVSAAEHLTTLLGEGSVRRITVGRVNGRRFLFSAGLLFDAELVRRIEAHRSRAGRPGDVAFLATMFKLVTEQRGRFDPVLEVDGVGRAAFLLVANADPYTFVGRLPVRVARSASLERGLDALAPAVVRPRDVARLLAYVLTGRALPRSVLHVLDADRIAAHCDRPLPLQADGEDLGDVTDAVFEAERAAVSVLAAR